MSSSFRRRYFISHRTPKAKHKIDTRVIWGVIDKPIFIKKGFIPAGFHATVLINYEHNQSALSSVKVELQCGTLLEYPYDIWLPRVGILVLRVCIAGVPLTRISEHFCFTARHEEIARSKDVTVRSQISSVCSLPCSSMMLIHIFLRVSKKWPMSFKCSINSLLSRNAGQSNSRLRESEL